MFFYLKLSEIQNFPKSYLRCLPGQREIISFHFLWNEKMRSAQFFPTERKISKVLLIFQALWEKKSKASKTEKKKRFAKLWPREIFFKKWKNTAFYKIDSKCREKTQPKDRTTLIFFAKIGLVFLVWSQFSPTISSISHSTLVKVESFKSIREKSEKFSLGLKKISLEKHIKTLLLARCHFRETNRLIVRVRLIFV